MKNEQLSLNEKGLPIVRGVTLITREGKCKAEEAVETEDNWNNQIYTSISVCLSPATNTSAADNL